tara:strand:- start:369 stop:1346 length:978 start_codon:yes stop_codon:yes gene_type:complete
MDKKRKILLDSWVSSLYSSKYKIETASSDASFRNYYRIHSDKKSKIIMDAPPKKEPLDSFLDITKRLKEAGVNVPEIYEINEEDGFILMTDFGNDQYLHKLNDETVFCLYTDALDTIRKMQSRTDTKNLKLFNTEEMLLEMNLFKEWFLERELELDFKSSGTSFINECFQSVIKIILIIPTTFMHRDYHSRNLMVMEDDNPGVLDYQDALIGPITYDLASLLNDCYIKWHDELVDRMIDSYYKRIRVTYPQMNLDEFKFWFDVTALQRHLKAIGIFSRLKHRDKKEKFVEDIPRTYSYINSTIEKYSELDDIKSLLNDLDINKKI